MSFPLNEAKNRRIILGNQGNEGLDLPPLFPSSLLDATTQRFLAEGIQHKLATYLQNEATNREAGARDTFVAWSTRLEPSIVNIPNYRFTATNTPLPEVWRDGPFDKATACAAIFLLQEGMILFNQTLPRQRHFLTIEKLQQDHQKRFGVRNLSAHGQGIFRLAYSIGKAAYETPDIVTVDQLIRLVIEKGTRDLEKEIRDADKRFEEQVSLLGEEQALGGDAGWDREATRARLKGFVTAQSLLTELRNYPWAQKIVGKPLA